MTERRIEFSFFDDGPEICRIYLNIPTALEEMPVANLRKLFRPIFRDYNRNRESIEDFFTCIPSIEAMLKKEWDLASIVFQQDYKDTGFDESGHVITDKNEKAKRRANNDRLMRNVKKAKARYYRFKMRIPKIEEILKSHIL